MSHSLRASCKVGYRKGIALGLGLWPWEFGFIAAGVYAKYVYFLIAIFALAAGVTLLQSAANPYMVALEAPDQEAIISIWHGIQCGQGPCAALWCLAILEGMEALDEAAV